MLGGSATSMAILLNIGLLLGGVTNVQGLTDISGNDNTAANYDSDIYKSPAVDSLSSAYGTPSPAHEPVPLKTKTVDNRCPRRTAEPHPRPHIPNNYFLGCPPGFICRPNDRPYCEFEPLPELEFVCNPEDCYRAPEPPKPKEINPDQDITEHIIPLLPPYYVLDPYEFGLDNSVFYRANNTVSEQWLLGNRISPSGNLALSLSVSVPIYKRQPLLDLDAKGKVGPLKLGGKADVELGGKTELDINASLGEGRGRSANCLSKCRMSFSFRMFDYILTGNAQRTL